jgi:Tannase and feruloyl esterase
MNFKMRKIGILGWATILLASLSLGALRSAAVTLPCTQPVIQSIAPPDTTIVSATEQSDPVSYCDVRGYVTTNNPGPNQVNFELALPTVWNRRFLFVGNGGFAGSFDWPAVSLDAFNPSFFVTEVSAGFATAITDTGHQGVGDLPFLDGTWALNDPAKQDDWLLRGVHVSAAAAKPIIQSFYGTSAHSYFAGCSDGGREGLVEAEQYPADFDGIIAGDPFLGDALIGSNWNEKNLTARSDNYIPPDKLDLVDAAVMQSCDATDGVLDGLIQDPRKCKFDPASLLCTHGDEAACLTSGQVATLQAIYAGASGASGRQIFPGFTKSDPTGDPSVIIDDGWGLWITGFASPDAFGAAEPWSDPGLAPWMFILQDQFLKFFVFSDPNYNSLTFNINGSDLTKAEAVINHSGAAATNPDLSAFRNRGERLILYHGWSDPALTPLETVKYYNAVVRTQDGLHRTQQFARLFMVPGMRHCIGSGGPGPNVFDPLSSLIDWVENGVAPEQILAAHFKDNDPTTGIITRTMPLCPYPKTAVFQGGNVNEASNWKCKRQLEDDLSDDE